MLRRPPGGTFFLVWDAWSPTEKEAGVSMELEQTGKGLVWWRREEKGRLAG